MVHFVVKNCLLDLHTYYPGLDVISIDNISILSPAMYTDALRSGVQQTLPILLILDPGMTCSEWEKSAGREGE